MKICHEATALTQQDFPETEIPDEPPEESAELDAVMEPGMRPAPDEMDYPDFLRMDEKEGAFV